MLGVNIILYIQFALLSLFATISCQQFRYDLPRCESTGCYQHEFNWEITKKTIGSDIEYIAINGEYSLPPIWVEVGKRIRITVTNKLDEDVTLHFHGLLQNNFHVFMDGPQSITQRRVTELFSGIFPGSSFTYDIYLNQSGTYWIHSHAPGQYPKGLRMPLIVTDPADKWAYSYTNEAAFSLSDWWRNFTLVESQYLPTHGTTSKCGAGVEAYPVRAVMNDNIPEINGRSRQGGTASAPIKSGERTRLRFVNMSAYSRFYVFIEGHKMQVIELDGVRMLPGPETDGIEISSGQRVSVQVSGLQNNSKKRYAIIAVIDPRLNSGSAGNGRDASCIWKNLLQSQGDSARIQYVVGSLDYQTDLGWTDTAFIGTKLTTWLDRIIWTNNEVDSLKFYRLNIPWTYGTISGTTSYDHSEIPGKDYKVPKYPWNFNELDLTPISVIPKWTDVKLENIHFLDLIDYDARERWGSINSHRFKSPEAGNLRGSMPQNMPTLLRALDKNNPNAESAASYGDIEQTIIMKPGEIHWFVLHGTTGDHPIHLHGHHFQILAHRIDHSDWYIKGETRKTVIKDKVTVAARDIPSMRDTVMVEKYTMTVLAVKADNPGIWALHCHNDFHSLTGMMMQIVESPQTLRDTIGTVEFFQDSTGAFGYSASDPPGGRAPVEVFDDYMRQAWHNIMNLFLHYWFYG